ncbi:unnamed protein product [Amoebophrya sp. A25]|nr:unnamed protein product [Amoebophrya sp. A25]|eukprot:GSA25T00024629001.1
MNSGMNRPNHDNCCTRGSSDHAQRVTTEASLVRIF